MRLQLDAEIADRSEARGPQFTIKHRGAHHGSARTQRFDVTQDSGPALADVLIRLEGEGVYGIRLPGTVEDSSSHQPEFRTGRIAQGSTFLMLVAMEPVETATPVHVTFECQAQDGADTWRRSQVANVPPPARFRPF
jgi:hypothetical protein